MRDLQERKRLRRVLNSPITCIALFIIVIFLIYTDYDIYKKNQITKINRIESDKKLALLKYKYEHLTASLEKLNTERGMEEELRNKFQVTKGGEEVLIVVDEDNSQKPAIVPNKSYWQRFKEFFK